MSLVTKQKILEASIALFNEQGLASVRLQQIANEAGISVGNLAYHFKNKEAIATYVYSNLFEEFADILSTYLSKPDFTDLNHQLSLYFNFFQKHRFCLTDLLEVERTMPGVAEKWRECLHKMYLQIRKRIDFNMQRKTLIAGMPPAAYDLLANNIWMTIVFWMPQQVLRGKPVEAHKYQQAVWNQILPYLTPAGHEEYQRLIVPAIFLSDE